MDDEDEVPDRTPAYARLPPVGWRLRATPHGVPMRPVSTSFGKAHPTRSAVGGTACVMGKAPQRLGMNATLASGRHAELTGTSTRDEDLYGSIGQTSRLSQPNHAGVMEFHPKLAQYGVVREGVVIELDDWTRRDGFGKVPGYLSSETHAAPLRVDVESLPTSEATIRLTRHPLEWSLRHAAPLRSSAALMQHQRAGNASTFGTALPRSLTETTSSYDRPIPQPPGGVAIGMRVRTLRDGHLRYEASLAAARATNAAAAAEGTYDAYFYQPRRTGLPSKVEMRYANPSQKFFTPEANAAEAMRRSQSLPEMSRQRQWRTRSRGWQPPSPHWPCTG